MLANIYFHVHVYGIHICEQLALLMFTRVRITHTQDARHLLGPSPHAQVTLHFGVLNAIHPLHM